MRQGPPSLLPHVRAARSSPAGLKARVGAAAACAFGLIAHLLRLILRVGCSCGRPRLILGGIALGALLLVMIPEQSVQEEWGPDEPYTVVVTTYERWDLYETVVRHYHDMPGAARVILVWNNVQRPEPLFPDLPRLVVVRMNDSQTQNRFLVHRKLVGSWVLNVDDDLLLPLAAVRTGYDGVRAFHDQLVGYTARSVVGAGDRWHYSSFVRHSYHVVIGQAFWSSRAVFTSYSSDSTAMASMRQVVTDLICCDDLALNVYTSWMTTKPPVLVRAGGLQRLQSAHFQGKSVQAGWRHRREEALARFALLFSNSTHRNWLPLLPNHLVLASLSAPSSLWDRAKNHPLVEFVYKLIGQF